MFLRLKPSSEPTVKNYGLRSDYREHQRTLKYSVSEQAVAFTADSERLRTMENSILAEGVSADLGSSKVSPRASYPHLSGTF